MGENYARENLDTVAEAAYHRGFIEGAGSERIRYRDEICHIFDMLELRDPYDRSVINSMSDLERYIDRFNKDAADSHNDKAKHFQYSGQDTLEWKVANLIISYAAEISTELMEDRLSDHDQAISVYIVTAAICGWAEVMFGQSSFLSAYTMSSMLSDEYSGSKHPARLDYILHSRMYAAYKDMRNRLASHSDTNPLVVFSPTLDEILDVSPDAEDDLEIAMCISDFSTDYVKRFSSKAVAEAYPLDIYLSQEETPEDEDDPDHITHNDTIAHDETPEERSQGQGVSRNAVDDPCISDRSDSSLMPKQKKTKPVTKKEKHINTDLCKSIGILLALVVGCFLVYFSSGSQDKGAGKGDQGIKDPNPVQTLEPISVEHGQLIKRPSDECLAPLSVETSSGRNYYIYLQPTDPNEKKNCMSFYVEGGKPVEVLVPLGTYEIFYATGDTWYGREHKFGEATSTFKCDKEFTFSISDHSYTGWTLTLYAVSNGNLSTTYIPESDFPE